MTPAAPSCPSPSWTPPCTWTGTRWRRGRCCARAPVLQRPELTERAVELLGFLWEHGHRGAAMAHYLTKAGEPGPGAPLLVDQATMAAALLDAYEVTAERRWLERAQALAGWADEHLRAADGRLHDRLAEPGASAGLLARPLPVLDENALMAEVLLRLEAYTGVAAWRDRAREILAGVGDALRGIRRRRGGLRAGAAPLPGTAGPHRRRGEPRRRRGAAPARRRACRAATAPHRAVP